MEAEDSHICSGSVGCLCILTGDGRWYLRNSVGYVT
jgi:hypothetical protein